ncbi:MAG: Rid family detoxifying hydrolase [Bacteroidota bacterium]|jgi:2-iminobutanoate/2-iminopropanoate deaminase
MSKSIVTSKNAPAPIGPYNQAVWYGDILFVSGQIALDPVTGELVLDSIEVETDRVLKNLQGILQTAGLTFENVLKCSVFVTDMNDFSKINAVYGNYFNEETAPARELVQVAALPRFVHVEISLIAGR